MVEESAGQGPRRGCGAARRHRNHPDAADRSGLTDELSAAVSRPEVIHNRGLRDVAEAIADGSLLLLTELPGVVITAAIAIDLLCWTRLLLLDGPLAKAELATRRYRLLHTAARMVNHFRMLILRIPETWPWAQQFADAFNRVLAIP